MNWRKFFLEAVVIILGAVICATFANAVAARERKLALVGMYGNATTRPAPRSESPATATAAPATTIPTTTDTSSAAVSPVTTTASTTAPATAPAVLGKPTPQAVPPAPAATPQRASRQEILKRFPPHPNEAFKEITGEDAMWLHQQGALFLDARRSSVYEQGHVAGARSVSVWEVDVDDKVKNLLDERQDQDLPIVVYCSGGACEDSHMLAQKLWGVFFTNVLVYKDGWPDWQKRGGASAVGPQ